MSYRTHRGYLIPSTTSLANDDELVEQREAQATLWLWNDAWVLPSTSDLKLDESPDHELQKLQDTVRVCTGAEEPHQENAVGVHLVKRPMYSRECEPRYLDYFLPLHAL